MVFLSKSCCFFGQFFPVHHSHGLMFEIQRQKRLQFCLCKTLEHKGLVPILEECNKRENKHFPHLQLRTRHKDSTKDSRYPSATLGNPAVFQDQGREWWCLTSGPGDGHGSLRGSRRPWWQIREHV